MPESRDRLSRPDDVTAMLARRRRSIGGFSILVDEPEMDLGTPLRWGTTPMTGNRGPIGVVAMRGGIGFGRGSFGTPRVGNGRGRNLYGSPALGHQNTPGGSGRRSRARSTQSVLPSWYPRRPLQDITAVVRGIERRRARLREIEGQQIESPTPQDQIFLDPSVHTSHDISTTPNPTIRMKPCPESVGKVPKIWLGITNQNAGESGLLTPQKKLLNSIDIVEKVVMEELRKLKRTPSAKKAEREKRVRNLMSMR
uniref:Protein POLYCHOME-like n=1 Tax=Davidia involucrata TaxID=16924 RepID=A0A5B7CEA0_DAVIN